MKKVLSILVIVLSVMLFLLSNKVNQQNSTINLLVNQVVESHHEAERSQSLVISCQSQFDTLKKENFQLVDLCHKYGELVKELSK